MDNQEKNIPLFEFVRRTRPLEKIAGTGVG